MRFFFFLPLFFAFTLTVYAKRIIFDNDSIKEKNTTKLVDSFKNAKWFFHSRTFGMSTLNQGALKDDYAIGTAVGLGLITKRYKGFELGVKGYVMYNLASSAIDKPDSLTFAPNRYELGLFDITNPSLKNHIARLEELYLKYSLSKSTITVGKQNLNTPFFNAQDGRLRPTVEEAVWFSMNESKFFGINGGWVYGVSPRSTASWYTVANSIGIYPVGVSSTGKKVNYFQNIQASTGMAIANIYINPTKNIKINLWGGFLENVMNTGIIEINAEQNLNKFILYEGLIYLHQDAINNGGNIDPTKTYMDKKTQSNALSAQVGIKNKRFNSSINYTHITGDGRYLMPREWGKDIFYTFLPRERNEGFGNVHAIVIKTSASFFNQKLKTGLGYGYFQLPDVLNYRLNKYGMPSYHQINLETSYTFHQFLEGLELKMLIAAKPLQGETYNNLKYVYNKVNMLNFNFIIDFKI